MAEQFTPKHDLPYYQGGDAPAGMTQQQALAEAIEANVATLYDVLANRPAVGATQTGQMFFATDTLQLFVNAGAAWREIAPHPPQVSSLPASPINGQEVYFEANLTDGIIWHLRYRSASASLYKWEFVGGAPLHRFNPVAYVGTATLQDIPSPNGPEIVTPLPGVYDVAWGGQLELNLVSTGLSVGGLYIHVGADTVQPEDVCAFQFLGNDGEDHIITLSSTRRKTIPSGNADVRLAAQSSTSSATCTFDNRFLQITPVKVGPIAP